MGPNRTVDRRGPPPRIADPWYDLGPEGWPENNNELTVIKRRIVLISMAVRCQAEVVSPDYKARIPCFTLPVNVKIFDQFFTIVQPTVNHGYALYDLH